VDLLVKGKADLLALAPKWCIAWESISEFYELSYWIQVCSKAIKYDTGSEFYELSHWIWFCSKVLKYPTGYLWLWILMVNHHLSLLGLTSFKAQARRLGPGSVVVECSTHYLKIQRFETLPLLQKMAKKEIHIGYNKSACQCHLYKAYLLSRWQHQSLA
jgi:hypothetical protein